jgi:hypothetical protein
MADASARDGGNAWQGDRLLRGVADRIGRSATVALLLSPVGVVFVSVARLLFISDYNSATASAIASSDGYVDALLGTVIPLIPIFLPYLALVLLFFNRVIPGLLALLATAFISPVAADRPGGPSVIGGWGQVGLGILWVIFAIPLLATLVGIGFGTFMRIACMAASVALLPAIAHAYPLPGTDSFYTQLLRQPWLPAETFTLSSGQQFTGYQLSDGSQVEVLINSSRAVAFYPESDITGERICETAATMTRHPLIRISSAPGPQLPACVRSAAPAPLPAAEGSSRD